MGPGSFGGLPPGATVILLAICAAALAIWTWIALYIAGHARWLGILSGIIGVLLLFPFAVQGVPLVYLGAFSMWRALSERRSSRRLRQALQAQSGLKTDSD